MREKPRYIERWHRRGYRFHRKSGRTGARADRV